MRSSWKTKPCVCVCDISHSNDCFFLIELAMNWFWCELVCELTHLPQSQLFTEQEKKALFNFHTTLWNITVSEMRETVSIVNKLSCRTTEIKVEMIKVILCSLDFGRAIRFIKEQKNKNKWKMQSADKRGRLCGSQTKMNKQLTKFLSGNQVNKSKRTKPKKTPHLHGIACVLFTRCASVVVFMHIAPKNCTTHNCGTMTARHACFAAAVVLWYIYCMV